MSHEIREIRADDPTTVTCTCGLPYTAPTLAGAVAMFKQHQAANRFEAKASYHVILIRDVPGEHYECSCGGWRFDSPRTLDVGEEINAVQEWADHVEFEDRYGD